MTTSPGYGPEPGQGPPARRDETVAGDPDAAQGPGHPGPSHRALWSWRRWAVGVLCVVLLGVAVRAEAPMIAESVRSFAHLRWVPLVLAVAAETGSMVALGLMERRILIMGGLRLPVGRSLAIAYASNALSASLPVIGSGAATAFTYRRLVSQGATSALAGWALVLSGVASNVAFILIISIGAIVSGNIAGVAAGAAGTVLTLLVAGVAVIAVRRPAVRDRVTRAAIWTLTRLRRLIRHPAAEPAQIVADALAGLGAFGLNRRDVIHATASAFRNWAFDLLCLAFSIKAAGAHVPWWGIILAWAAGTGSASLNLTPGGLGVVEAALTGALIALGLPGARALTAVLVYRGITFWLATAVGWVIYWRLRREHQPATTIHA
jgi:uncharacterized protein (TIRG00374 family)